MSEESCSTARLIPVSGISGAEEQERRATSALLAVMGAVKEFSRALLQPLGAPAGTVEMFIEVGAEPVVLSPEEQDTSRVLLETLDEPPSSSI